VRFLDHLERSALRLYPPKGDTLDERHAKYIESFQADHRGTAETYAVALPNLDSSLVLNCVEWLLREDGFDTGGGIDHDRKMIVAEYHEDLDGSPGIMGRVPRVSQQAAMSLGFHFGVNANDARRAKMNVSRRFPSWAEEFQARLAGMLARTPAELQRLFAAIGVAPDSHNPVVAPGERLASAYTGNLLDYSGCATAEAVRDLEQGDLPLGRYTFGYGDPFLADVPARPVVRGKDLFLANDRTGQPMLYKGALVCAPQNSGKTRLIYRWAAAANRAGYSVFLIDVKGNMYPELAPRLSGKVFHFTTDPLDDDSDGINFLTGLYPLSGEGPDESRADPVATLRVRQLVEAILPKEGWEQGEQAYFYQNHVSWMAGLLQLLLLFRNYRPQHFIDGEPDLSYLYDLARDEDTLWDVITKLREIEGSLPSEQRLQPGVDYWVNEISLLISADRGGQRTREYSYRTLTQSIVNALQPFSQMGTLFPKISKGRDEALRPRRFFSLESLNDPTEPVTIIFAAREQDLDDSRTTVSIAMKKMQHFLFDRMTMREPRPVVLLLDEARRIRGFSPADYITFARQAKAGCVVVYQSLDQIGEPAKIRTILENVGVQIYLGSLVGETARHFIDMLPKKRQATFSFSQSRSQGEASHAVQTGYEVVDYFSTAELYRLPAGRWPALVYINDLPRRDPILVDMEESPV